MTSNRTNASYAQEYRPQYRRAEQLIDEGCKLLEHGLWVGASGAIVLAREALEDTPENPELISALTTLETMVSAARDHAFEDDAWMFEK